MAIRPDTEAASRVGVEDWKSSAPYSRIDRRGGPEAVEPPKSAPLAEHLAYWQERATWATRCAEYEVAVSALARLPSGQHTAAEPAPAPLALKTRPVLHREILERDTVGRLVRVKAWTVEEPVPEDNPPPRDPPA